MIQIADISELKGGKKKVVFLHSGIFRLLREHLRFRHCTLNKKGYYLEYKNGTYTILSFVGLRNAFLNFVVNDFDSIEFNIPINKADFIEECYKQLPLKRTGYAKSYLSKDFTLTEENKHKIMLAIDDKYAADFIMAKTREFLNNQAFVETVDKIGNFYKDCILYYKKAASQYIVVNVAYKSKSLHTHFDLWRISAKSENDFLHKKFNTFTFDRKVFDLKKDFELFETEIKAIE
ncbi:MAG: hypothetical protein V4511_04250 [Bacteroidota bacterium]